MMAVAEKKATGSYYTCNSIADYIASWAIDSPEMCVLEPSFGDGIFIDSAFYRFSELGNYEPNIIGVEIQKKPYNLYIEKHTDIMGFQMSFMDFQTNREIDAVIGNPPYISLKNLKESERKKAFKLVCSYGVNMQTSASMWLPFIIHSTELLKKGGKLGFVLPYEITYVRYAFDLWKYLSKNYGKITICRIYDDFFPDVDVETVLLLAEKKGETTNNVCYKVFNTVSDLFLDNVCHISQISIDDIINLRKPFERELIPDSVATILERLRKDKKTTEFVKDCKFKIGYVSGNKGFFHISESEIKQFKICPENIKKSLINARQITANGNIGIETAQITDCSYLFYPTIIGSGEKKYIKHGEKQGINNGYKCKVRNPWYLVPGVEIPDMVLTVFGDIPKLMINDGNFYVSNSLLGGFSKVENRKELICRWYNSLTLLSIEATIHSLGGGTLVLIPGETDKLEIISEFPTDKIDSTFTKISNYAQRNATEDIYKYGDDIVLKEIYGLSNQEINEIRKAVTILRNWRNPEKRRNHLL